MARVAPGGWGRVATTTMDKPQYCFGATPHPNPDATAYNAAQCGPLGWRGKVRVLPRAPYLMLTELGGGPHCSDLCLSAKVSSYQGHRNLPLDGKLGPGTLRALKRDAGILQGEAKKRAVAKGSTPVAPTPEDAMASPAVIKSGSMLVSSMMNWKGALVVGGGLLALMAVVQAVRK